MVEHNKESMTGLTRRRFMQVGAGALGALATAPLVQAAAALPSGKQPNILIVITDQQNVDSIAALRRNFTDPAWGCHWVKTPNLDRLVEKGVSFTQAYTANPVCSPARSTYFTGRTSIETGMVQNNIGIDRDVPNMGQWFESHSDYRRIYCGKWHAGGQWNYPNIGGPRKIPGFETMPVGSMATGDVADYQVSCATEAFLRNYDDQRPFLFVAGLMNPHDICFWADDRVSSPQDSFELGDALPVLPPNMDYQFAEALPGKNMKLTDMQWRNYAYDYYRMVEKIDSDVGRIMDAVENRGGDTLVIFTSDHGEGLGRHRRTQKWHPYQHSVNVPLIVSWPGHVEEGKIDDRHLVSSVDLMSTVCDFAGIPAPPHARGYSLKPLLNGQAPAQWRDHVYSEWRVTGRIIRTDQYKYVTVYRYSGDFEKPFLTADGRKTQFMPGHGNEYQEMPEKLLFDLHNDPWEMKNLAGDSAMAETMRSHEKLLREWEARLIPGMHYDRN